VNTFLSVGHSQWPQFDARRNFLESDSSVRLHSNKPTDVKLVVLALGIDEEWPIVSYISHRSMGATWRLCEEGCRAVFLNRRATARYRTLASIIPGRERP